MIKRFIISKEFFSRGIVLVRIATGLIITSYGLEIFDAKQVEGYTQWLTDIKFPFPYFMASLGKVTEFAGGIFLTVGFLTRIVTIPLMITMAVITFIMGDGNVRSDSFLLLLLFLAFFIHGSGNWSLDHLVFSKPKSQQQ